MFFSLSLSYSLLYLPDIFLSLQAGRGSLVSRLSASKAGDPEINPCFQHILS